MHGGLLNDTEVGVFDVTPKAICGEVSTFYEIDISRVTIEQLDFTANFEITLAKYIDSLDAFAIWFDTFFLPHDGTAELSSADALSWESEGNEGTAFSTGPYGTATHWHQAVLLVGKEDRGRSVRAGSTLKGTVTYRKRRRDARGIEVEITWEGQGKDGPVKGSVSKTMA